MLALANFYLELKIIIFTRLTKKPDILCADDFKTMQM
jgi:hypothetical protein